MVSKDSGDMFGHLLVVQLRWCRLGGMEVTAPGQVENMADDPDAGLGALLDLVDHVALLLGVLVPRITAAFF